MSEQYAVSVIDGVDIQAVTGTMHKIGQFQSIVKSQLKQNYDYGIIPGTPKPALLKPGAEKILMLLGLRSKFDIVDSTRDFEKGFFQYQVKCKLYKGDQLITEGLGSCNNRERKYIKQDPFTMDNTILKMARKRSLTDAALTVGSLSDIFTQDLDEIDIAGQPTSGYKQAKKVFTDQDGLISKAQAKRMFALADGKSELVKEVISSAGFEKTDQIPKTAYEGLCAEIQERARSGGELDAALEAIPLDEPL